MKNLVQKNLNKKNGNMFAPGTYEYFAYQEGYSDFEKGFSPLANPYVSKNTRDAWDDGYYSAKHMFDVDDNL